MSIPVGYVTDPACPWSWAREPDLRRLEREFGADLEITYVLGGLAREFGPAEGLVREWLDAGERSGMPVDPRLWWTGAPKSSFPACLAVKAAADQGAAAPLLRSLRVGLMARRRKLDNVEALVEEARRAGLDEARFRMDLGSHATVEAFGADLERAGEARGRMPVLRLADGTELGREDDWVAGVRTAARAGGAPAAASSAPGVEEALRDLGPLASPEVAAACDLPGPRAEAELWRLALEWRARPERLLTGWMWSAA